MSQTFNGQSGGMIASLLPQQQQMVYGLDGTAYPSADAARAAGVFDFRYAPPMAPVPSAMPSAMPMAQAEGLPFSMPAARGSFNPLALRGSGLLTEAGSAVLPNNVPMYENTWKVPDYLAPARVQAMQAAGVYGNGGGGYDGMSGGGSSQPIGRGIGADNLAFGVLGATDGLLGYTIPGALANYAAGQYLDARTDYIGNNDFGTLGNVPGGMGTFADQYGNVGTYSNQGTLDAQIADLQNAPYSGVGGGALGSINNSMNLGDMLAAQDYGTGGSYDSVGQDSLSSESVSQALSDAGYSDTGGYGEGNTSTSSKIVCTAMNHAYGFGGFRNKIWLAYAAKHLTKAHEVGYHTLFLPLVAIGYNQGDKMHNRIVRRVLENIARHRSTDLRAEMRGTKRDPVGRVYRLILEPLCFAVGKLKGY
jgi:hypothetical protein